MAKYDYNTLREAAQQNRRIGGWQGYDVYACSKYKYKAGLPHFYVIYDDGNKLVRAGYVYGTISPSGVVGEHSSPIKWEPPVLESKWEEKKVPATNVVAETVGDVNDFFCRIDREINELLANAREGKDALWT